MFTQSPPNTQSRANTATLRNLHHMCLGSGHSPRAVGRADCMCLHGCPCVWLPFAAVCYTLFYLLMMPAARLVCQRPSSNFLYFRTPLANFLLSRPISIEYGNSKTTTLLPSAKCTCRLFQSRTGCCGRPSGWHDIVTCQPASSLKRIFTYRLLCLAVYWFCYWGPSCCSVLLSSQLAPMYVLTSETKWKIWLSKSNHFLTAHIVTNPIVSRNFVQLLKINGNYCQPWKLIGNTLRILYVPTDTVMKLRTSVHLSYWKSRKLRPILSKSN